MKCSKGLTSSVRPSELGSSSFSIIMRTNTLSLLGQFLAWWGQLQIKHFAILDVYCTVWVIVSSPLLGLQTSHFIPTHLFKRLTLSLRSFCPLKFLLLGGGSGTDHLIIHQAIHYTHCSRGIFYTLSL